MQCGSSARRSVTDMPASLDVNAVFELMALSRAALMSGALERVLDLSLGYAKERKQFGSPSAAFRRFNTRWRCWPGR